MAVSPERQDAERADALRAAQKAAEGPGGGTLALHQLFENDGKGACHSERSEESLVSRSRAEPLYKEAKDSSLRSE